MLLDAWVKARLSLLELAQEESNLNYIRLRLSELCGLITILMDDYNMEQLNNITGFASFKENLIKNDGVFEVKGNTVKLPEDIMQDEWTLQLIFNLLPKNTE